jgi:hypothetical protein
MGAVLGVSAWSRGQEKITKYQTGYFHQTGYDDGYGNEFETSEPYQHNEDRPYRYKRRGR